MVCSFFFLPELLNSCTGLLTSASRDSEESAPAEYPPEQPEADALEDDGTAYGAEEVELENALIKELEEADGPNGEAGEDQEMDGGETTAGAADDDASDAGSEDLEAESSDDEEEDEEEEGGEEDVEMGDDSNAAQPPPHQPEVMVH